MSKRLYWLKLKDDFFRRMAIKKLRRQDRGDTKTIIYLKMMLQSLKSDGVIYYEGIEGSIEEELSLYLDEDLEDIESTVQFLFKTGLAVIENDCDIRLTEVKDLTGSETDKAEYMRKKRERDKLSKQEGKAEKEENGNNVTNELPSVTFCYTEKRERENIKENRENIEERREEKKELSQSPQDIVNLYHEKCPSMPKCKKLTAKLNQSIYRLMAEHDIQDFEKVFDFAENSDFLQGKCNGPLHANWKGAGLEFLIMRFKDILLGKYDSFYAPGESPSRIIPFQNFEQRDLNLDEMEAKLLSN